MALSPIDGTSLGLVWAAPFVGLLLSIALFPLFASKVWERRQGTICALWAALTVLPLGFWYGSAVATEMVLQSIILDYAPFILLLFALFTVAGGIFVRGNRHGSPLANTMLLAIGAGLSSLIGTTGASMVMIRPVLRANDARRHNVHVVVFFIFLVSNIGGALTPLGDPPLFLGFLRGVDFFWTTTHLLGETLFVGALVLGLFFLMDSYLYKKEGGMPSLRDPTPDSSIKIFGGVNFGLILAIPAAIILGASVPLGAVRMMGIEIEIGHLLRDAAMVAIGLASLFWTRPEWREANGFSWAPLIEVAKLFAAIFLCIVPVLMMLKAGGSGAFAPLIAWVTHPDGSPSNAAYFWMTGGLSSLLDNAPTYLVFFELAGGDASQLMTKGAATLAAISSGAVFMGANSYLGNAPNFMVYAIAKQAGVRMPGFFGYMLWSGAVLIPVFVLTTFVFFR